MTATVDDISEENAGEYDFSTPEELLEKFRQGDSGAFRALLAQCGVPLFGFLYHYLGDYGLAADAYRRTWAKIARADDFDARESLRFWLFATARNTALDIVAAAPEAPALAAAQEIAAALRRHLDANFNIEDFGRRLTQAVTALPLAQRDVFLLREDADLTFREIGAILGCPPANAQKHLADALDTLLTAVQTDARLTRLLSRL